MRDFAILMIISVILTMIIALLFGINLDRASSIADLIITFVLLALFIPFIVWGIKDRLKRKKNKRV